MTERNEIRFTVPADDSNDESFEMHPESDFLPKSSSKSKLKLSRILRTKSPRKFSSSEMTTVINPLSTSIPAEQRSRLDSINSDSRLRQRSRSPRKEPDPTETPPKSPRSSFTALAPDAHHPDPDPRASLPLLAATFSFGDTSKTIQLGVETPPSADAPPPPASDAPPADDAEHRDAPRLPTVTVSSPSASIAPSLSQSDLALRASAPSSPYLSSSSAPSSSSSSSSSSISSHSDHSISLAGASHPPHRRPSKIHSLAHLKGRVIASMVIDNLTLLQSSTDLSPPSLDALQGSPQIEEVPRTFQDVQDQLFGAVAASRSSDLPACTQGLPLLFSFDYSHPRASEWRHPEPPKEEQPIHLVSGNEFKCFYAKSFHAKPHALYIGQGPDVKSVVIAVRPKIDKVSGLRASLRPQDFAAAKSKNDFSSVNSNPTLAPAPSAAPLALPEGDDSVYLLIFSQFGTWRTVLRVSSFRLRAKLAPLASKRASNFPSTSDLRDALRKDRPDLKLDKLARVDNTAPQFKALSDQILHYEDRTFAKGHKFGVVYCRAGQALEEDFFRNLHHESSPAYRRFLRLLGDEFPLKGYEHYAGGLDTRHDTTGTHTIGAKFSDPRIDNPTPDSLELIFHVPTLMPFFPDDPQAVERKRHVGNDIVNIIFLDPDAPPFCPTSIMTTFTHVYIVIREIEAEQYHVGVISRFNVPEFGPSIPSTESFKADAVFIKRWLFYKLVNAERASLFHPTFRSLMCQSRKNLLAAIIASVAD